MPFGLFNKTFTFVSKTRQRFVNISAFGFGVNVVVGYVEEITFNITNAYPANAIDMVSTVEVLENQTLIKKYAYITGATLTSPVVKKKIVGIISGATFTGLV